MWRYMATVDVLEHLSTVELLRLTEPYQLLRLGNLTHIGDRGLFDGHSFAFGAIVAHGDVLGVGCESRKSLNRLCSLSVI